MFTARWHGPWRTSPPVTSTFSRTNTCWRKSRAVHRQPNLLFSVLSNRIYVATQLGLHEEARRLLKRFRLLPLQWRKAPDPDLELKVFATGSSLEMALYARSGRFEEGVVLEKALVGGLEQHGERLSPLRQSGLCYQMAYLQFGAGHLDRALKWSHRQLNLKGVDEGAEVHDFRRLLNLLIHLELTTVIFSPTCSVMPNAITANGTTLRVSRRP